jgi:hypothetical protein
VPKVDAGVEVGARGGEHHDTREGDALRSAMRVGSPRRSPGGERRVLAWEE